MQKDVTLNSGTTIPNIGLGLWRVKNKAACKTAVQYALDAGYRHFDTAQIYGNEAFLGEALAASNIARKELFITTKIWNDNMWWTDIDDSFDASLKNLQTDYVDLLLLHFPVTELRRPAWHKMEAFAASGRAKAIGVSNYTIAHLEELLRECNTKPAVNQVELHVYLQQPELVQYCKAQGIVVEAYSPLAHGEGLDNPALQKIAKKHGKSTAQVMLRWCVEQDTVVLPKSVHKDRIQENLAVFDFSFDVTDLKELKALNKDFRMCWDPTHVA